MNETLTALEQQHAQTGALCECGHHFNHHDEAECDVISCNCILFRPGNEETGLPPVLDVCCGPKGMWFNKHDPRAVFLDKRRETHVDTYPCGTKTNVIDPCVLGDFTELPFPNESFRLIVFDPPHIEQIVECQITKKYGVLQGDWRETLRCGFMECFRVLKPEGVLIFKWNDCQFPVKEILALTPEKPLFGHKSGKKMGTHWITFLKS